MVKSYWVLLLFLLSSLLFVSCRPVRFLDKNQYLLTKVKYAGVKPELADRLTSYTRQKPNRKFLLVLYNTFNTSKGRYKSSDKIKSAIGEAPVLYDSVSSEGSARNIQAYLKDEGYFDCKVRFQPVKKKNRAYLTYFITLGSPYRTSSYQLLIADSSLKALFEGRAGESFISPGKIYNVDDINSEQTRITNLYRANGYFKFTKQYVRFLAVDTLHNHTISLTAVIDNPDSGRHKRYTIDSVLVHIAPDTSNSYGTALPVRKLSNNLFFDDAYRHFRPRITRNTIYLKSKGLFDANDQLATYSRLAELGVFREIKISYPERALNTSYLINVRIDLTERRKLNISTGADGDFNGNFYGFTPNATYTDRNFFGGAEVFELRLGGTLNKTILQGADTYDRREFSVQASVTFPFLALPFYRPYMGRDGGLPHTSVLARYTYVFQPLYLRREFSASLSYQFEDTKARFHIVTPVEITLLRASLDGSIFNRFLTNGNQARLQSFTSSLIAGSAYSYEQNAYRLRSHANFAYLKASLEVVGNAASLIKNLNPGKEANQGKIFGLPYYRYVKPELDLRIYKTVGPSSELILRLNPGVAYSYGKNNGLRAVPFDRQFFVGGPNSIRAWLARQLGPGSYLSVIPPNTSSEALRSEIQKRSIDQTGEVKLQGNAEYRFTLTQSLFSHRLAGATFLDFGNIWLLRKDSAKTNANFKFDNFARQIAIGTGFGLRYDLSFFIFRFDLGLKLYDPIFTGSEAWVIKNFGNKAFKENYTRKFGDDLNGYRFLTYNFGIGFPF